MAGRAGKLHDVEGRGDAHARADASFPMARWRLPRQPDAAQGRRAQGSRRISSMIGKPLKRLDTPDKVNGKAVYGIDAMPAGHEIRNACGLPGVRRQGRQGRRQRRQEDCRACSKIVVLDDLVAVVGDHMWAAKKGLEALKIDWDEGPNAKHQLEGHLAGSARRQRKGRRGREIRRRYRQGPCDRRQVRGVATNCRFSRMRPWSRSTPRFISSRTPARSGPARRS